MGPNIRYKNIVHNARVMSWHKLPWKKQMNYIRSQRRKNPMSDEEFNQWLVGFIDGEGN